MKTTSENRLSELVKSINDNRVTYNGLVLTQGHWTHQWDCRPEVKRLILTCNKLGENTISRISIRDVTAIKTEKLDKHTTNYIVLCRPKPLNGSKHIFRVES